MYVYIYIYIYIIRVFTYNVHIYIYSIYSCYYPVATPASHTCHITKQRLSSLLHLFVEGTSGSLICDGANQESMGDGHPTYVYYIYNICIEYVCIYNMYNIYIYTHNM